ncbi:MAG: hypothetical protein HC808_06790 [Candidatus Competibacteraceae bacterium]|nr:hypothetical protein [Candidatus Competibacteraceae bacterium]
MRGFVFEAGNNNAAARAHLQARIGDYGIGTGELPVNFWLEQFRIAFNDPAGTPEALITYRNIALAIAEYERSQIFVETPWKAYVEGDDTAISRSAKRGGVLFSALSTRQAPAAPLVMAVTSSPMKNSMCWSFRKWGEVKEMVRPATMISVGCETPAIRLTAMPSARLPCSMLGNRPLSTYGRLRHLGRDRQAPLECARSSG